VRGMGYYTGTIFEVAHPSLGYSLGGGGRYDVMIGRFTGSDVPAVGFSLGFERLVDLVSLDAATIGGQIALVYDVDVDPATLVRLQAELIRDGKRVRLELRPRKLPQLLDQLSESGFTSFATVRADTVSLASLEFKPIGGH